MICFGTLMRRRPGAGSQRSPPPPPGHFFDFAAFSSRQLSAARLYSFVTNTFPVPTSNIAPGYGMQQAPNACRQAGKAARPIAAPAVRPAGSEATSRRPDITGKDPAHVAFHLALAAA